MLDAAIRKAAEGGAVELLRDTIGTNYSDTILRVTADQLLSSHRAQSYITEAKAENAVGRLFEIASGDTGQSARIARFLMEWWSGTDLSDFPIADLLGHDTAIADNMAVVVTWLGHHPGAVYADASGRRANMEALIARSGILDQVQA